MNIALGPLVRYDRVDHGLELTTAQAMVSLHFYGPGTLRIRIRKTEQNQADFSYAVIAKPTAVPFTVADEKDQLILTGPLFRLVLTKSPLRFSFTTLEGKVINQDDPAFGTSWIGQEVTTYKSLQPGERFIGLGGKTGPLDRRGNAYTHWNTDKFAYSTDEDPLYISTPFFIGLHTELAYGIYLDNTFKTEFNFGASTDRFASFSADDGEMDYYFFHADSVAGIIEQYTGLTGRMPLPPKWSLGYQQCRFSYFPDTEVLRIAETFREKQIPADVIYLDIHYMDAYKVFTWHPERFPNPSELIEQLKALGFQVVVILDPGVKKEAGYPVYDEGLTDGRFVQFPDGEPYSGRVWPGWSHFPDFTDAEVRDWWAGMMPAVTGPGVQGFWNDMNEPAAWGQALPNLIEFSYDGRGATHKGARNVYGFNMARATYDGARANLAGKRPFVLTRAGFSGIQRYSAVWTGDNVASMDHLLAGVRMVNSLGLTGVAFSGYDVGGFIGEADPALYIQWIQVGAFSPFFRGHSMINSRPGEPWAYGEDAEAIARNYINLRYRLMPYVYSAFAESARTGLPLCRSLAIEYGHDPNIFGGETENQYLFGSGLLIVPIGEAKDLKRIYLPAGNWYDFFNDSEWSGSCVVDLRREKLPVFVKASTLLPMQSVVQHNGEQPNEVLELHVYAGDVVGTLDYYEDDGESFAYASGDYYRRKIRYVPGEEELVFEAVEGEWASQFTQVRVCLHGFSGVNRMEVGGVVQELVNESVSFLTPLPQFDPFPENAPDHGELTCNNVLCASFEWGRGEMRVRILKNDG